MGIERPNRHEELAGSPVEAAAIEMEYLDLDGDGVPDAVRTTRTVIVDHVHQGGVDLVEVTEELASGIGVDGVPRSTHVVETVDAAFPGDPSAGFVDVIEYDLDTHEGARL